jgi:hypothetical protein
MGLWKTKADRAYDREVDKLNEITAANTGLAGDLKAQRMAKAGSLASGESAGQSAQKAALASGANAEVARSLGDVSSNSASVNAYTGEYNKAQEANQQEIAEQEQQVNEANKRRAESKEARSKIAGLIGTVAGTALGAFAGGPVGALVGGGVGGGLGTLAGNAISDERTKILTMLKDSDVLSKSRVSKIKNRRLINAN